MLSKSVKYAGVRDVFKDDKSKNKYVLLVKLIGHPRGYGRIRNYKQTDERNETAFYYMPNALWKTNGRGKKIVLYEQSFYENLPASDGYRVVTYYDPTLANLCLIGPIEATVPDWLLMRKAPGRPYLKEEVYMLAQYHSRAETKVSQLLPADYKRLLTSAEIKARDKTKANAQGKPSSVNARDHHATHHGQPVHPEKTTTPLPRPHTPKTASRSERKPGFLKRFERGFNGSWWPYESL